MKNKTMRNEKDVDVYTENTNMLADVHEIYLERRCISTGLIVP